MRRTKVGFFLQPPTFRAVSNLCSATLSGHHVPNAFEPGVFAEDIEILQT